MTLDELKSLGAHSRIKYVGSDPAILKDLARKKTRPKEVVLYYVYDYTGANWAAHRGLSLRCHGLQVDNVIPADWDLVDSRRVDLVRSREKRNMVNAEKWVKQELAGLAQRVTIHKHSKYSIDHYLEKLTLPQKMHVLTSLSPEEKIWFDAMHLSEEDIRAAFLETMTRLMGSAPVEEKVDDPCTSV